MRYSHPVRGSGGGGSRTPLTKWETEGQVVEGEWRGTRPGKYGDLGIVRDEAGAEVVFPLHTVLAGKVTKIKIGAGVSILYKGKVESKSGTTYKDFDVFTEGADSIETETEHVEEDGDGVPF